MVFPDGGDFTVDSGESGSPDLAPAGTTDVLVPGEIPAQPGPVGPVNKIVIHEVTVVGPPPEIAADPVALGRFEDAQDGYLAAERDAEVGQITAYPIGPSYDYVAGYQLFVQQHPESLSPTLLPGALGAPGKFDPDRQLKEILEFLDHQHEPHTEVPEFQSPPPSPPPISPAG